MSGRTLLTVWVTLLAALAIASSLPVESHPKLRRSVDNLGQFNRTGRQLIVLKDTNSSQSSNPGVASISGKDKLLQFLEASSQPSLGDDEDELIPRVTYYRDIGIGYAVEMNAAALITVLRFEDVEFVEDDYYVTGEAYQYPIELNWATDRVDQRYLPLDRSFRPKFKGRGVDIYILDSGIRYSHSVFGGRARYGGYDAFNSDGRDCHGHGTHCAGLAAGKISGVAYEANVYSIRVLNCNNGGTFEGIISGINHVINRAKSSGRRSVISMSLIGPLSSAGNRAVQLASNAGIVVVVAAGNFRQDACNYSPSSSPHAITVGGTQEDGDKLYWFSTSSNSPGTNYGKCVDIFAPGQWVRSASHTSAHHFVSMSGTSMSTPIVAGVAATILEEFPSYTPQQVFSEMRRRATSGVIDMRVLHPSVEADTVNLLVYVPGRSSGGPVSTSTPTTSATTQASTSTVTPITTTTRTTTKATTSAPTAAPRPGVLSLPSHPSKVLERYNLQQLQRNVNYGLTIGYVPTSFNAYTVQSYQYFSTILTYVGQKTGNYKIFYGITISRAYSLIRQNRQQGFQPMSMAVYTTETDEVRIVMTLEKTNKERRAAFALDSARWSQDAREMHRFNYSPITIRYHTIKGGFYYISTIYEKNSNKRLHWEMSLAQTIAYIYNQRDRGTYVTDITYRINTNGEVRYAVILDTTRYGSGQFYIQLAYRPEDFDVHKRYLEGINYHGVAITPLPEKSVQQVGYFAIYWR